MSWQNFDMFQFEAALFSERVEKLVVRIHFDALKSIDDFYNDAFEKVGEQISAAKNEDDHLQAWNDKDMLDYEKWEQVQALATMALAMLGALIEAFLRDTAKRMDHIQPSTGKKYEEGSKLDNRIAEYEDRFGIDLCGIPGFDGVREVILARNSCLHGGGKPSKHYYEQTKARLVDTAFDEKIILTPDLLKEISGEVREFADVLYQHLGKLRTRLAQEKQNLL